VGYLSIFRSCARKEYADQVIKMLRAVEGEQTRTTYRLNWVTKEALHLLDTETNALCVANLTDRDGTHALPSRIMTVVQHEIDSDTGTLKLILEVGPFIRLEDDFIGALTEWGNESANYPPEKFVSVYQNHWPSFREAEGSEVLDSWRRAVEFVTTAWDFRNSIFLRPANTKLHGRDKEITISVDQADRYEFEIASYNPHLTDVDLSLKTLHVTNSGAIADIDKCPPIDRDGVMSIGMKFLEPGASKIQINILPDPQFSTYIPIAFNVLPDSQSDPIGPRLLGPEWSICLDEIGEIFEKDDKKHLEVLKSLSISFPHEPEVMLRRGLLHLRIGQTSIARDLFKDVLKIRESARGVAWLLASSLKAGAVNEAEALIQRLNLSDNTLFEKIVDYITQIDEDTAIRFIDLPGLYLSEDNAIQLVQALGSSVRSQEGARKVTNSLSDLDKNTAFKFAKSQLLKNPEWRFLRRDYVQLADQLNIIESVSEDVSLILRCQNEKPSEVVDRVDRLGDLVHPSELLGILLFNSAEFFARHEDDARIAGLDQATKAAAIAFSIADFSTADLAIQQVFNNLRADDSTSQAFASAVSQIAFQIAEIRSNQVDQVKKSDSYTDYLLTRLSVLTKDKNLVVIGGADNFDYQDHWRTQLGLKEFRWVSDSESSESNGNFLMELDPQSLLVVFIWNSSPQISSSVNSWLEKHAVICCRAFSGSESILHSMLRTMAPNDSDVYEQEFLSPLDVVSFARKNLLNLQINPAVEKIVSELDSYPLARAWAKKVYRALIALNEYSLWRSSVGASGEDFYRWLGKQDSISPNWVSMKESESLAADARCYRARIFPVDKSVDPSGQKYMEAHIKIDHDHPAPRIHFFDASDQACGKVLIGYIGPHLPTPSGH